VLSKPNFFVGKVPVYGDLILAPMAGFSDLPYRSICRSLGSSMSYTEFVNVDELSKGRNGSPRARQKLCYQENERPVVFQIYGHDVDRIVSVAQNLQDLGPDIIDINMGCYVKKIAERGAGAGMLRRPNIIAYLMERLVKTLDIPVTAKIRLGWDDNSRNYMEVARALADHGASLVAVHGRTRSQAYSGEADWDAIAEIKQALSVPVVGNGDVRTVTDIDNIKAHTGCDAVMIGRAVIGNPWILQRRDRQEITLPDRMELVRRHLALNLKFYGVEKGLVLFRKHVARYIEDTPARVRKIRVPLLTCERVSDFENLLCSLGSEVNEPVGLSV
jgi:nifR3 family TIM-barrel protein|tara:strand:- start:647 stop:1639 length:993 start_codon:yes stop_codon:yes gene_type:complete